MEYQSIRKQASPGVQHTRPFFSPALLPNVVQKTPAQGAAPKTLKDEGVSTTDPAVRGKTPQIIDQIMARNARLAPYIQDKIKAGPVANESGKFRIEGRDADYFSAYEVCFGEEDVSKKTMGFYCKKTKTIHLRPGQNFGTALHEAIHKYSNSTLINLVSQNISPDFAFDLNEGLTAFFTDCVLRDEGLSDVVNDEYKDEKRQIEKLVKKIGFEKVADLYFTLGNLMEIARTFGIGKGESDIVKKIFLKIKAIMES